MMRSRGAGTAGIYAAFLLAMPLSASVTTQVDILDPSDGGAQPPAGILVIDVLVDVTEGDSWTAAGIRAVTLGGVTFRYAHDPNSGAVVAINPGTSDRFVSVLSEPRGRDANNRFTNGGAGIASSYCGGASARFFAEEMNVAWFASPPETIGSPTVDGAVLRVALDISAIGLPQENFVWFSGMTAPPGVTTALVSFCTPPNSGTVCATFDVPSITGFDWGVGYIIPEPAMGGFFLLVVVLVRRRGS